jgi:hypothetical protein
MNEGNRSSDLLSGLEQRRSFGEPVAARGVLRARPDRAADRAAARPAARAAARPVGQSCTRPAAAYGQRGHPYHSYRRRRVARPNEGRPPGARCHGRPRAPRNWSVGVGELRALRIARHLVLFEAHRLPTNDELDLVPGGPHHFARRAVPEKKKPKAIRSAILSAIWSAMSRR